MLTREDMLLKCARRHARIVEIVHVNDELRFNVVLPDGTPRTWKAKR